MFLNHIDNLKAFELNGEGMQGVQKQILVSPEEGWQGWVMRRFILKKEGHTPYHRHPWPHINYVLSGEGILKTENEEKTVEAGSVAYIPADSLHQFLNKGEDDFSFICIVPEEGEG